MSNPSSSRCALTGGSGFVGSRIRAWLQNHGWQVVDWNRRAGPAFFRLGSPVEPRQFDQIDALVHCAYDFEPRNRADIWHVNVDGSKKLFEAARQAAVKRILFISSLSAFDGCRSLYGRAKLEIEQSARAIGAQVLRPGLVYGDQPGGMFGRLASQVRSSRLIPVITGGKQTQYLVHADDLAAVVQHCLEKQLHRLEPISVAHEQPWLLRELLREIARVMNKSVTFVPVPWQTLWIALRLLELGGMKPKFRSDSLISMVYQNPSPAFETLRALDFRCRPFEISLAMVPRPAP